MDRRIFTKTALGLVAGTVGLTQANAAEAVKQKSSPAAANPPSPDKFDDDSQNAIKVIQSKRGYKQPSKKADGVSTSILFFADIHLVTKHLLKIKKFSEKYRKYIDDTVHLGDSVGAAYVGKFDLWDSYPTALNVIGNHDTYDRKYPVTLSDNSKYDIYFKKYVDSWNVVQPENAEADGKCYWHKDYNKDVRLIGIDCMNPDDKQFAWFVNALNSAQKAGLKVAIATHVPPSGDEGVDCNFNSLDYGGYKKKGECETATERFTRFVDAVDAFIDNGGCFVSWICGHFHHDRIMHTLDSKHKQLIIVMECATDFNKWTDADHARGTPTSTCWEIISIESISHVIKIARFGNNFDHYLRHKGTLCYDFKNHKLISQY